MELVEKQVFTLWAVVIVATIVLTILGTILTTITLTILNAIRTQSDTPPRLIDDERAQADPTCCGYCVAYIVSGIVVFGAMLSYVLKQPALVMFSLLILAGHPVGDLRLHRPPNVLPQGGVRWTNAGLATISAGCASTPAK